MKITRGLELKQNAAGIACFVTAVAHALATVNLDDATAAINPFVYICFRPGISRFIVATCYEIVAVICSAIQFGETLGTTERWPGNSPRKCACLKIVSQFPVRLYRVCVCTQ